MESPEWDKDDEDDMSYCGRSRYRLPTEDEMIQRQVQLLVHSPELMATLNLLRRNPGLRSVTLYTFSSWSERMI